MSLLPSGSPRRLLLLAKDAVCPVDLGFDAMPGDVGRAGEYAPGPGEPDLRAAICRCFSACSAARAPGFWCLPRAKLSAASSCPPVGFAFAPTGIAAAAVAAGI